MPLQRCARLFGKKDLDAEPLNEMCIWNAGPGALASTGPVHVLMIAHSHQAPSYGAIAHENGAVCALVPLRECADSCIKPLGFHQGLKSPEFHLYVTRNDYNKGHALPTQGPVRPPAFAVLSAPLAPPLTNPHIYSPIPTHSASHRRPCTCSHVHGTKTPPAQIQIQSWLPRP